jgi:hypothetical protein
MLLHQRDIVSIRALPGDLPEGTERTSARWST